MLAGYLQNGEAVIMKHANREWRNNVVGIIPYWQVAMVHDEFQTETLDNRGMAEALGKAQADAIRIVGEKLGVKCPLAGNYDIGYSWHETH